MEIADDKSACLTSEATQVSFEVKIKLRVYLKLGTDSLYK